MWAERFLDQAAASPDRDALRVAGRSWTFAELGAGAGRIAGELTALGVVPGAMAAVAIARGPGFVFALCGAKLAGAVPVLVDPTDREVAAAACARLGVAAALVDPGPADAPVGQGGAVVEVDLTGADLALRARGRAAEPRILGPGLSHIIHTSGSTSQGKSTLWTERRAARYLALRPPLGTRGPDDCAGVVSPLCTALGFPAVLRGLVHGRTLALIHQPFPLALEVMEELGVTGFTCTPTHAELILRTATPIPRRVRVIAVSGAPIGPDRLAAFAARVAPALVSVSYGLTETGPVTHLRAAELGDKGHTVGRPIPGRLVMVVDRKGAPLPAGQSGHVVVRFRAFRKDGYLHPRKRDARRFRRGLVWTGDRGHFDADGYLVLEGRAAELLKVGGRLVSAPRIEEVLAATGRFAAVAVVGVAHPELGQVPAAVYMPRAEAVEEERGGRRDAGPASPGDLGGDRGWLAERLRPDEIPRWFLPRRLLPYTATGKLRRGLLTAEAGRWAALWPARASLDGTLAPARDLELAGRSGRRAELGSVAVVDGAGPVPPWAGRAPGDPGARVLSIVDRSARRTIGLAWVAAGIDAASNGVRVIAGPIVEPSLTAEAADRLLAAAISVLVEAAAALPGRPAGAFLVEPGRWGAAWGAAGFTALAGVDGWLWRGESADDSAEIIARRVAGRWGGRVEPSITE